MASIADSEKRIKLLLLCSLLFLPAAGNAVCMSTDLSLGVNVDVTPYGIEIIQPGAAVHLWFDGSSALCPGLSAEFYYRQERFDMAFNLIGRYDFNDASAFAGLGLVYELTESSYVYPEAELGARFVFADLFTICPLLSVRVKPHDTDTDLRLLAGLTF